MKTIKRANITALIFFVSMVIGGCGSSESSRFYLLSGVDCDENLSVGGFPDSVKIGIGPIKIPDYLQGPAIPVYNSDNEIVYSEFDRWAEPLDMNFSRVFRENLTCALGTLNLHVYPWRNPKVITHELSLEIVNFEVASDSSLNLKVFWQFSDFRQTEILKKGVFNENYKISKIDFDEIIRVKSNSLSDLCEALSTEILTVIRE